MKDLNIDSILVELNEQFPFADIYNKRNHVSESYDNWLNEWTDLSLEDKSVFVHEVGMCEFLYAGEATKVDTKVVMFPRLGALKLNLNRKAILAKQKEKGSKLTKEEVYKTMDEVREYKKDMKCYNLSKFNYIDDEENRD